MISSVLSLSLWHFHMNIYQPNITNDKNQKKTSTSQFKSLPPLKNPKITYPAFF